MDFIAAVQSNFDSNELQLLVIQYQRISIVFENESQHQAKSHQRMGKASLSESGGKFVKSKK